MTAPCVWLFDFDNTLAALEREVDWTAGRRELEAFLRAEGVAPEIFAEIPKRNLPLYRALHSRWLRSPSSNQSRIVSEAILDRASAIIERYELAGVDRAAPTAGAIELLRALAARGLSAAIVTSNSSRTVARWLDRHRVASLVRAIVGRDSMLALKPSPEMLHRALEISAAAPAAALFVGDSEADLGAARAAGIAFCGIAANSTARQQLLSAGATLLFASPAVLQVGLNLGPSDAAGRDNDPD